VGTELIVPPFWLGVNGSGCTKQDMYSPRRDRKLLLCKKFFMFIQQLA